MILGRALLVLLAAAYLGGCGGANPVVLSDAWPEQPGDYEQVHRDWTQRGTIRTDGEEVLEVYATFKSPVWRAAYAAHSAKIYRLSPAARQALEEDHKRAAAEYFELYLLMSTYERNENDLQRGERSVWRIVLIDDRGNEVEPVSVVRDRRPREVIRADNPDLGDFAVPYIVKFPHTIDALRDGATHVVLMLASPRGAVELRWQAAR